MRFLLLLLLGLAIVGMHGGVSVSQGQPDSGTYSVNVAGVVAPAPSDVEATDRPGDSGLPTLHLCVVILAAAGALLRLIRWLRATAADVGGLRRRLCSLRPLRPVRWLPVWVPPSSGRDVLAEVCVLRV